MVYLHQGNREKTTQKYWQKKKKKKNRAKVK